MPTPLTRRTYYGAGLWAHGASPRRHTGQRIRGLGLVVPGSSILVPVISSNGGLLLGVAIRNSMSLGAQGGQRCEQPDLSTFLPASPPVINSWLGFWRDVIRSSRMACPAFRTAPASKRAADGVTVPLSVGSYGLRLRLRCDLCPPHSAPAEHRSRVPRKAYHVPNVRVFAGLPPRWFSATATRLSCRRPLQMAAEVGKIGRLLFSLFLTFS